jgi:glutaminyl-peptide cyclotransferase
MIMRIHILILFVLLMFSCNGSSGNNGNHPVNNKPNTNVSPTKSAPPVDTYEIVNEYKHDKKAFTQGLVFYDGFLYEGTGGKRGDDFDSSLRKVEIETGKVLQKFDLSDDFFGEGIVILNDKIYQLTWQEGVAFVYDLKDFKLLREFRYSGEGWGLTTDGTNLYQSDGTPAIRVVNPETFETIRTIIVFDENRKPINQLNELEYIKGEIWANIWQDGKIARINPKDGTLLGWIDLTQLVRDQQKKSSSADVLNGIAYDSQNDRLFVTGKKWQSLFEIKIKPNN